MLRLGVNMVSTYSRHYVCGHVSDVGVWCLAKPVKYA